MPDFYCLSGKRTTQAETILSTLGQGRECYILEGGLQAWKAAGLPIVANRAAPDIMRQVQTIAGSLILLGVLAGWLVSPWFYLIDVMVGAGLLTAGLTGFCGMARLLAKNAMESLSKGRLKVAAEAIMTDNSTSSFADKREK